MTESDIRIKLKDRDYTLVIGEFDDNIEIEDLLKTDLKNIIGELVTYPVIMNRFGVMLASADSQVTEAKFNLEVYEARFKDKKRKKIESEGGKKLSVDELNSLVLLDVKYQVFYKKYINIQKTRDVINSIYWAAKDKSSKLEKLSLNLTIEDFAPDRVEEALSSTLFKVRKRKNLIN